MSNSVAALVDEHSPCGRVGARGSDRPYRRASPPAGRRPGSRRDPRLGSWLAAHRGSVGPALGLGAGAARAPGAGARPRCRVVHVVVYGGDGSPESRQAASCQAIGETLRRAGLGAEPDVRPASVAAWAGARVLADTDRIEAAVRALGCRSLDAAARLIGLDWRATETPR